MTSLNQAAYNILNHLRGGRSSNNDYLSLEQVKYNILYYRALYARQTVERGANPRDFEQDLGLVEMEIFDIGDDEETAPVYTRSTLPLPIPVRLKHPHASGITWVGKENMKETLPIISPYAAHYHADTKYAKNKIVCYLKDHYLYTVGDPGLVPGEDEEPAEDSDIVFTLRVHGVFENPQEAVEFRGLTWSDESSEFPIPIDVLQKITNQLFTGELKILSTLPNDATLDQLPDNVGQ